MTPVQGDGIYCTVQAHEVEQKTSEGWQLVGIIEADTVQTTAESQVSNGQGYAIPTMRCFVVQTPLFLLRRGAESELGRMALALDVAKKDANDQAILGKAAQDEWTKAVQKNQADGAVISDLHRMIETLKATRDELRAGIMAQAEDIKRLEERLGKSAKPTSFERLMADEPETPPEVQDPLV